MATQNNNNPLRYTGLTYEDIKSQIDAALRGDERFENFVDSALYKMILNIFAGTTDLTNYYVERTAEESFLDTAKHLSSVILNANNLGYVVRRPTGASANVNIVINGPIPTATAGQKITIQGLQKLTYNSVPYILLNSYEYTLSASDAATLQSGGSISFLEAVINGTTESVPIKILQGEIKEYTIYPESQAGLTYQRYNIEDPSFSNYYGTEDFGGGEIDSDLNLTKVFIKDSTAPSSATGVECHINRRSLTAEDYTVQAVQSVIDSGEESSAARVCLIKTSKDTTADIYFGDGVSTILGPSVNEYIKIQYFSVLGLDGNQTGILGQELSFDGNAYLNGTLNINDNIQFYYESNPVGGSNLEEKESIRLNAPAIYQSLDRLVTRNDYNSYLKTVTNPIEIKYGVAWGEAEEIKTQQGLGNDVSAILQLFNVVLSSGLGSIYKQDGSGNWSPKGLLYNTSAYYDTNDVDTAIIEGNDPTVGYGKFSGQAYFDLYIKNGMTDYMSYIFNDTSAPDRVATFLRNLFNRSQATVKNVYIPPIIQGFELRGTVVLKSFSDAAVEKTNIENSLYKYLSVNTGYEKPLYISKLTDVVNEYDNVVYSDLELYPIASDQTAILTNIATQCISNSANYSSTSADIITACNAAFSNFITSADADYRNISSIGDSVSAIPTSALDINENNYISISTSGVFTTAYTSLYETDLEGIFKTYVEQKRRMSGFTERAFYENFAKPLYQSTSGYVGSDLVAYSDSIDFKNFVAAAKALMQQTIRNNMIDDKGNIVNYSFPNEIALINSNITFSYGS